jgi:hypothetical protein
LIPIGNFDDFDKKNQISMGILMKKPDTNGDFDENSDS